MSSSSLWQHLRVPLFHRLRRPQSESTVPGSLPVLFFGDVFAAGIVTVGINPSRREYSDRSGVELDGSQRRFETLHSLGASSRNQLSDDQCDRAIETMRCYFDPERPAYSWFSPLERVLGGLGVSYGTRQAGHLDLVQEATDPTWSELQRLRPDEAAALLASDLKFLHWQLSALPSSIVLCNGRSVLDAVCRIMQANRVESGALARIKWSIAVATVSDKQVAIAGWNIPLARPTGLTIAAQTELGALFASKASALGIQAVV